MKFCAKNQTITHQHSADCSVVEHPLNDPSLDFAIASINGRYPDKGYVVNQVCKELAYVAKGHGKIVIDNHEQQISAGDVVLIEPKEKYYWQGELELHIACHPKFSIEQHQRVAY